MVVPGRGLVYYRIGVAHHLPYQETQRMEATRSARKAISMTTTPFPIPRRIPPRDSPADDNGAEEMLQDLMDEESKDSKASLGAIPGSEDLDDDDSAFDDIEGNRSEVHSRAIELPKNIATAMGYGRNPVIDEAGEVAFDSNAPDPGFEQGSIYRDMALNDAESIIEQGANDTDADDGFDLMMEQASTENDTLSDFEDALWEEDIDLLDPPQEAEIEKKKTPPLLPTTRESRQPPVQLSKFKELLKKPPVSQQEINRLLGRFYELERISPRKISQSERDKMALAKDSPSELKAFLQTGIKEYERDIQARVKKQESQEKKLENIPEESEAELEAKAEDSPEESKDESDPRGPYADIDEMQKRPPPFTLGNNDPPPSYEKSAGIKNLFKTKEAPPSTSTPSLRGAVDEYGGGFGLFGKKRWGKKRGRGKKEMINARR